MDVEGSGLADWSTFESPRVLNIEYCSGVLNIEYATLVGGGY